MGRRWSAALWPPAGRGRTPRATRRARRRTRRRRRESASERLGMAAARLRSPAGRRCCRPRRPRAFWGTYRRGSLHYVRTAPTARRGQAGLGRGRPATGCGTGSSRCPVGLLVTGAIQGYRWVWLRCRTPRRKCPTRGSSTVAVRGRIPVIRLAASLMAGANFSGFTANRYEARLRGIPHLRHSREGGNLSPAWCAITTPSKQSHHASLADQVVNLWLHGLPHCPSFPRTRESIPGMVRHHDPGSSPSRRPCRSGGESVALRLPPYPSFPRRRESIPGMVRHHDPGSSPSRRPCRSGGESVALRLSLKGRFGGC